jgi:hypothetical protein
MYPKNPHLRKIAYMLSDNKEVEERGDRGHLRRLSLDPGGTAPFEYEKGLIVRYDPVCSDKQITTA